MKLWPFQRRETRDAGFTEARLTAIAAGVSGSAIPNASAAVEIAAGLWARGFASAAITPQNAATAALTPPVLAHMGRALLKRGQAVFEIEVRGGRLRLVAASQWDVNGGPDPETWDWELTLPGPSETDTRQLSAERVLNITYSQDESTPWNGVGPLQTAETTVKLLDRIEARLCEEMGQPVGAALPVPNVTSTAALQKELRELTGELVLVESTASAWGEGKQGAPMSDWQPRRLGGDPPRTVPELREHVSRSVLAAAGVPVSLLGNADGTLAREGWRQFLLGGLSPVGRIIAPALAAALDTPDLAFDWSQIGATDIAGRARAFQSMVGGGMEVDRAAALAGLLVDDDSA